MEDILLKLGTYNLEVNEYDEKYIHLAGDYTIEVENANLYKLLQAKQVIAPFDDLDELCQFIKMDIQLNAEN